MSCHIHQELRCRAAVAWSILALSATGVSAQEVGPLPSVLTRADLQSVEAEALSYPERPPSHLDPLWWTENEMPGSENRQCLDVPPEGPVRSGDFALWYNSLHRPRAGEVHKVAWAPSENSSDMSLRVRARLIGDPNASIDVRSGIARTISEGHPSGADDRFFFFASGTTFSKAGEWVVVATSGRNWGCFVFLVTEAHSIGPRP